MFRSLDLTKAISDAIEASYYVSPDQPGLTPAELATVLAEFGFQPGEIQDGINSGSAYGYGPSGLCFSEERRPIFLTQFAIGFLGDPRDRGTFAFVHGLLRDRARAGRLENARIGISEIMIEGERSHLDPSQVKLAIYLLPYMGLAKLERETNTLCATYQTTTHTIQTETGPDQIQPDRRPTFAKMLDLVRNARALRDPDVQWRLLREALSGIGITDGLSSDEQRVLDFICSRFADTGDPVSLDDALRQMADIDVKLVALGGLEPRFNVHVCSDGRVVPSFRALHRYLDLFAALFLLVDIALQTAKAFWDRQESVVSFQAHNALVPPTRPGIPVPVEVKQLRHLIDVGSMLPALGAQSPGGRVEIRDEIRQSDRVGRLLGHQRNAPVRSRPRPKVTEVADSEYAEFLRAALHERSKISRLGQRLSLEAIARRAKMSNAQATEC